MGSRSGPAMLALLGVIALPLGAQETSYLLGRVIDAGTKAPLNGAFVSLPDTRRGVFTDPDGVFRLPGAVPNDARKVQIELMGYGIAELPARLLSDSVPLNIPLASDPILVEGFKVVSDRFRRRRNASTMAVRTFDVRWLRTTPATNVLEFLERQTFIREVPCSVGLGASASLLSGPGNCARVRGRVQPVTLCIDEVPSLGGLFQLASIPPQELNMVEVYGGGRMVRVYTQAFMEQVSRRRFRPHPIEYGC